MNTDLIARLWEEATGTSFPKPGKFTAGEYDHHIEKFARLLVRACAVYDSEQNNPDHQPGDMNQTIIAFLYDKN